VIYFKLKGNLEVVYLARVTFIYAASLVCIVFFSRFVSEQGEEKENDPRPHRPHFAYHHYHYNCDPGQLDNCLSLSPLCKVSYSLKHFIFVRPSCLHQLISCTFKEPRNKFANCVQNDEKYTKLKRKGILLFRTRVAVEHIIWFARSLLFSCSSYFLSGQHREEFLNKN
jgi:hypothetical protein